MVQLQRLPAWRCKERDGTGGDGIYPSVSRHILPKGFVRIGRYGMLSSSSKREHAETIRAQLPPLVADHSFAKQRATAPEAFYPRQRRPVCAKGPMARVMFFNLQLYLSRSHSLKKSARHWFRTTEASSVMLCTRRSLGCWAALFSLRSLSYHLKYVVLYVFHNPLCPPTCIKIKCCC